MRGFTNAFSLTSFTPSYENAAAAGSLSHTGNSFRPIGGPAKVVSGRVADIVQPSSYTAPVARPVKVTQPGLSRSFANGPSITVPVAHPVIHTPSIRGILGN
jgi:hypothetical protein